MTNISSAILYHHTISAKFSISDKHFISRPSFALCVRVFLHSWDCLFICSVVTRTFLQMLVHIHTLTAPCVCMNKSYTWECEPMSLLFQACSWVYSWNNIQLHSDGFTVIIKTNTSSISSSVFFTENFRAGLKYCDFFHVRLFWFLFTFLLNLYIQVAIPSLKTNHKMHTEAGGKLAKEGKIGRGDPEKQSHSKHTLTRSSFYLRQHLAVTAVTLLCLFYTTQHTDDCLGVNCHWITTCYLVSVTVTAL